MLLPFVCLCSFAFSNSSYRDQCPLPSTTVPDGWGVNIHFTDPAPGEMEKIADAGFKWVRMDFMWHQIEKKRGVYDFSAYDRLMAALKKQKMRPIFILDYGNDLYQQGSPRDPQSIQGFCNFVSAAVTHFKGQGVLWEMWNEPNIFFWQPKPDVKQYIALATEVGKTIRKAAPEEWYVGPATSGIDISFLDACFKAGLLKYWDAVTVHPYRTANPETVVGEWEKLRQLVKQYEPKRSLPLISGEWGYSEKYSGLSLEKQTQYIVRQYLVNLSCGVGLSIWYDWKDDGTDEKEIEHHFGTVYSDLKSKPTYEAAAALAKTLKGCTFVMRLRQPDPADWVLAFKDKQGGTKAIGWTTTDLSTSLLKLKEAPRLMSEKEVSARYIERACDFAQLPETAKIETVKELAALVKPLIDKLREGETLTLAESGPKNGFQTVDPIRLTKTDTAKLESKLSGLNRIADITTPVYTLKASLTTTGCPDIVQACELRRDIIRFQVVATSEAVRRVGFAASEGGVTYMVDSKRVLFKGSVAPAPRFQGYDVSIPTGISQLKLPLSFMSNTFGNGHSLLIDKRNRVVGILPSADNHEFLKVDNGQWAYTVEGDDRIKGSASGRLVDRVQGVGANKALGVTYSFDQGWKYLAVRNSVLYNTDLKGKPQTLSMSVKGDGSGCALKVRLVDSSGQTHQIDGMDMDWTDTRYITFDLTKIAVSWGGKNDGRIHYPVRFDTVLLIDGKGKESKGYLEMSDLVVSYED